MQKHYSLAVAEVILDMIMADPRSKQVNASVQAFQNGREQGYSIAYFDKNVRSKQILWAQERHSDNIIIYHGFHSPAALSKDAYDNGMEFKYDQQQGAADYILETLLENCHESEILA